jgi:hypothetical protein
MKLPGPELFVSLETPTRWNFVDVTSSALSPALFRPQPQLRLRTLMPQHSTDARAQDRHRGVGNQRRCLSELGDAWRRNLDWPRRSSDLNPQNRRVLATTSVELRRPDNGHPSAASFIGPVRQDSRWFRTLDAASFRE